MRGMIRLLVVFGLAGIFTNISSLVYAGEWDRAVGPARTVENAARDLRRRMERVISNRYSIEQAVRLERTAGEMVNLLQINSSRPGEVSHLLNELEGLHARVQSVVLIETNRRNDHALRAQADHLARRMTELRLALRRVSVDPLDCGVAGGLPYSSRYGDRDRFDSRFDSRHDTWHDSRFDSRFDSRSGDDWNRHYDDSWRNETRYYRSTPGGHGYYGGNNFGSNSNGFQGSVQTRNGRYSISIGR
jgi:hypothetical protein